MNTALRRVHPAITLVAAVVAVLALAASLAGAGYAAGTIGAKDLKKNSVTSAKIKKNAVTTKKIKNNAVNGAKVADGSLSLADLPAQGKQTLLALGNGGEGDCLWTGGASLPAPSNALNIGSPAYAKDLLGFVHLSGIAIPQAGPGGDGACDDLEDQFVAVLPAGAMPNKTMIGFNSTGDADYIIAGAAGINSMGTVVPPGTVVSAYDRPASIDGIDFVPAGSAVAARKAPQVDRGASTASTTFDQLVAGLLGR